MFTRFRFAAVILFTVLLVGGCGGSDTDTLLVDEKGTGDESNISTGTASLNWLPPTTYTDDTTLMDLAGHNIYMDSGNGFVKIDTLNSTSVSDYLVENLSAGTYTFAVTAFDSQGIESSYSNEATIIISL